MNIPNWIKKLWVSLKEFILVVAVLTFVWAILIQGVLLEVAK